MHGCESDSWPVYEFHPGILWVEFPCRFSSLPRPMVVPLVLCFYILPEKSTLNTVHNRPLCCDERLAQQTDWEVNSSNYKLQDGD